MMSVSKVCVRSVWDKQIDFLLREDTNDYNVIRSVVYGDEYFSKLFPYKEGDTFIDIGSHIGTWSLLMATINPTFKVYSYEPVQSNFLLLVENIKINNLSNVKPFNLAVSSFSDMKETIYYGDGDNSFERQHRFIGSMIGGSGHIDNVDTISINDIFERNKIDRCRVMKVDCEGCEVKGFSTITKENLQKIDVVVGEFHPWTYSIEAFFEFFKPYFEDITPEVFGVRKEEFSRFALRKMERLK